MVDQEDRYPQFPKLECSVCQGVFEIPRGWVQAPFLGRQIIIDWESADELMAFHHKMHSDDLINGVEDFLRADARRRGA